MGVETRGSFKEVSVGLFRLRRQELGLDKDLKEGVVGLNFWKDLGLSFRNGSN